MNKIKLLKERRQLMTKKSLRLSQKSRQSQHQKITETKYYPSKSGQHAHSSIMQTKNTKSVDNKCNKYDNNKNKKDCKCCHECCHKCCHKCCHDNDCNYEEPRQSCSDYWERPDPICLVPPLPSPCLSNNCGGYYDGMNGYVFYDSGNPWCTSRPGAFIAPVPFLPQIPIMSPCGPMLNQFPQISCAGPIGFPDSLGPRFPCM